MKVLVVLKMFYFNHTEISLHKCQFSSFNVFNMFKIIKLDINVSIKCSFVI